MVCGWILLRSGLDLASTFNYSPASADLYSITVTVTDSTGATSAQSAAAMVMVVVGLCCFCLS